jgi:hypothetical protein
MTEAAMENMISFAEVAGAIFMSFAVALTLQWIGLVGLIRLMPARQDAQRKVAGLSVVRRETKNAA